MNDWLSFAPIQLSLIQVHYISIDEAPSIFQALIQTLRIHQ